MNPLSDLAHVKYSKSQHAVEDCSLYVFEWTLLNALNIFIASSHSDAVIAKMKNENKNMFVYARLVSVYSCGPSRFNYLFIF